MKDKIDNKEIVTAFIKGLNVIKSFDNEHTKMTITEVANRVDITRASARRLLLTLELLGYVTQNNNFFSLTPKVIDLGYSYFAALPWTDLAYKNMQQIVDNCQLSCSISVLDGNKIICIMRIAATRILNEGIHVGSRLPAAYTPTGRLFMAHMEKNDLKEYVKQLPLQRHTTKSIVDANELYKKISIEKNRDYQIVREELEDGLQAIAVPIYNKYDDIIATMNVATHISYKDSDFMINTVLPLLQKAAYDTTKAIKLLKH